MTQVATSEKLKYSLAIDINTHLCGCLEVQKTAFEIPIDDIHYTIFVPTSAVPREEIKDVSLRTMGHSNFLDELLDYDDDEPVERIALVKLNEDYYYCKQEFSDISNGDNRNLFLLKPTTQLPPTLSAQVSLSASKNF
jgi:hypothetical protein